MIRQPCRDLERVLRVGAHPAGERPHSTQEQPAIKRRGDCAARALNFADAFEKPGCLAGDDGTAHDIGMAAEVFRSRVHDEIRAVIERSLQDRRPGVVANAKRTGVVRDFSNRGQVGDFQERIGWRFRPDQLCVRSEGLPDLVQLCHVHEADGEAPRHVDLA